MLIFHVVRRKVISYEEHTQLSGLFVHFLRCQNSYVATYPPIFPPRQLLLRCSTSCIIHMDVENADIAGANICPCSQKSCVIWVYSFLDIA